MFYLCYLKLITPTDSVQHDFYIKMMFVSLNRNMTCVLSPSKEHVFTLCFLWCSCFPIFYFLQSVLQIIVCLFVLLLLFFVLSVPFRSD
jgi:hypothetical protein